ncbi:T9SS type B sorting domain-containing protein [Lutibacter sp. B1]|uniref:T9SS type B sorting domain-containing protein n=1 Tax=Lutibacter sp. B1 TaxID=2725996 RepID=UPI0014577CDD|nr:T9SS type B sorting domain-containing protein [Lutibacter sp. B1]NLP56587.1 T9SS type B sorting domain-containing protein [Lutibacter sp. B1]
MKKLVVLIFLLTTITTFAQGEANYWFFGENAGLDFNTNPPTAITGSLNTKEGCSSFSDKDGNLLFYSDGTTVWNKNHKVMPNGTGLKGNASSTQSAMIIPRPESSTEFYLFTVGAAINGGRYGFYYYTIDITKDGGLGDIVDGPIDLTEGRADDWTEKVAAIIGNECNTYWVISYVENEFYAYKVTKNGVAATPVKSTVNYSTYDRRGYLKVSPDGTKIVIAHSANYNGIDKIPGAVILYDFNDSTGIITNPQTLPLNTQGNYPYGIEFSPNSKKLYVNASNDYYNLEYLEYNNPNNHFSTLFQFDISSPILADIITSRVIIDSQNLFRGGLQLAPDGKIYRALSKTYDIGIPYLGVIESPNKDGVACNYKHKAISLGDNNSTQGLPPFIASLLLPIEITDGITTQNLNNTIVKRCLGENYQLSVQDIPGTPTYKWTFNGIDLNINSSILTLTNLDYTHSGIYNLEAETIDDCGFKTKYLGEVSIEVYEPPTITKPENILQCDTDNDGFYNFDLNTLRDTEILNKQDPTEFEVVYFANQADADANNNPIIMPYTNSTSYGIDTLIARIHNKQNPICFETETFTLQVFESPNPPTNITNLSQCDSNLVGTDTDGFEVFDLTEKLSEILNEQSSSDFTIKFYSDATLTNEITNSNTFQNTTPSLQPVYVTITNNYNPDCFITTSFNVEVYELPKITSNVVYEQCDFDSKPNDGRTTFNLSTKEAELTKNNLESTEVTFYEIEDTSLSNPVSKTDYINLSGPYHTLTVKVENTAIDCYTTGTIDLVVSPTSLKNYPPINSCEINENQNIQNDAKSEGNGRAIFNFNEINKIIKSYFLTPVTVEFYHNSSDALKQSDSIFGVKIYTPQEVFVRIENKITKACEEGGILKLEVEKLPEPNGDETEQILCVSKQIDTSHLNSITLDGSTGNPNDQYQWYWNDIELTGETSPILIATKEGNYKIEAYRDLTNYSGFFCTGYNTFNIKESNAPTISINDIEVIDDSYNNSITINTANLGIGNYEFAIDDIDGSYQDEPLFENVAPGIRTVYIRDKNLCGIAQIEVPVIGYPRFFTPNNDGYNDTWKVLGTNENFYPNSNIYIFDRFGKLITLIDPKGEGWNGSFNGKILPAADYWFSVELIDSNGNIKVKKGHFSLIR